MITQLKNDLYELFSDNTIISEYYENYNDEYKDIVIKEKYEKYPKISYPMITIEEINNEDINRYYDDSGENVSYLAYQFNINAEQDTNYTAVENVTIIARIIDTYLKGERYRCLRRIGSLVKKPLSTDDNVMTGYLRYDCNLDIKNNVIYRRY